MLALDIFHNNCSRAFSATYLNVNLLFGYKSSIGLLSENRSVRASQLAVRMTHSDVAILRLKLWSWVQDD